MEHRDYHTTQTKVPMTKSSDSDCHKKPSASKRIRPWRIYTTRALCLVICIHGRQLHWHLCRRNMWT